MKLTPKQQFENIWKIKQIKPRQKSKNIDGAKQIKYLQLLTNKEIKDLCYQFFLDGWGCCVLDRIEKENK